MGINVLIATSLLGDIRYYENWDLPGSSGDMVLLHRSRLYQQIGGIEFGLDKTVVTD